METKDVAVEMPITLKPLNERKRIFHADLFHLRAEAVDGDETKF